MITSFLVPGYVTHLYGQQAATLLSQLTSDAREDGWEVREWEGPFEDFPSVPAGKTMVVVVVKGDIESSTQWTLILPDVARKVREMGNVVLVGVSEGRVPFVWKFCAWIRLCSDRQGEFTITKDQLTKRQVHTLGQQAGGEWYDTTE